MKIYTFLIGSMDDFESQDELIDYVETERFDGDRNYSCFEFECSADNSEELVMMIGRGYAFSNDWAMDHTVSFMVTGSLSDV